MRHGSALDYDLMTRTGRSLDEWLDAGAAGMVALAHFCRHLDTASATWRSVTGRTGWAGWDDGLTANRILTDIYNAIAALNHNFVRSRSKKRGGKPPKPYPAPWARQDDNVKHFGKDPIKASRFWDWWKSKDKKKEG